jgi:hypothetical protein
MWELLPDIPFCLSTCSFGSSWSSCFLRAFLTHGDQCFYTAPAFGVSSHLSLDLQFYSILAVMSFKDQDISCLILPQYLLYLKRNILPFSIFLLLVNTFTINGQVIHVNKKILDPIFKLGME